MAKSKKKAVAPKKKEATGKFELVFEGGSGSKRTVEVAGPLLDWETDNARVILISVKKVG